MLGKTMKAVLAAGTILAPVAAFAQDAPAGAASAPPTGEQLSEIIVTAQRRQQTLQDVPVAVAVLGSKELAEQKISSVETLGTAVPNLVVQRSPFQPFVAIRGLGSGAGGRAFEQSVATYVDGIYAGRANQFLNPFGPGTFGRTDIFCGLLQNPRTEMRFSELPELCLSLCGKAAANAPPHHPKLIPVWFFFVELNALIKEFEALFAAPFVQ